ncbi:gliding motility-associated C-terminal domain-containing protein [Carboxylicivirga mesophila]|uniref:Gliding motility-associated C-terminal domain-containing protein n=1 Tax=Carboxylicivirga mesophila TaxID=1166478 RepID=A0ABS5KFX2_9BACT|nr:gliding motility-associated C-terminal domain-containing protein [Carboxylicivirga mesophila]MBS2213835.1 gliding motility-associated C-terminal domain-containing protein [Carboxylicivirga mesophila]
MRTCSIICILLSIICFQSKGQDIVYANDDKIKGFENSAVNIPVLNNDFGLEKGVSSLTIVVAAEHGTAVVEADNTITFIPNRSFVGSDDFIYKVCNADGNCDEATVFVEIEDVDFQPEAVNDTVTYLHGNPVVVDFMDNDIIEGDEPITVTILGELYQGTYFLNRDNMLEVEFERRFVGKDSLDYVICDVDNDCSQARIIFYVQHGGDIDFYIPEGFSPNGDGINDTFYIPDFSTYQGISITVVDSWGGIVYENASYQNDWNGIANKGSKKGQLVPAGTYYYIIAVEGVDKKITGFVYVAK